MISPESKKENVSASRLFLFLYSLPLAIEDIMEEGNLNSLH